MCAKRHPAPSEPMEWLHEVALAYMDAREAIPFGDLIDQPLGEDTLFHLAPVVCLKMRGFPLSGARLTSARDAALTSYVATTEQEPQLRRDHLLVFAFCYLASHFGLDLLREDEVAEIMDFIEQHRDDLARLIDVAV